MGPVLAVAGVAFTFLIITEREKECVRRRYANEERIRAA